MGRVCLIADGSEALCEAFRERGCRVVSVRGEPDTWTITEDTIDVLVCAAHGCCEDDGVGLRDLPDSRVFEAALGSALVTPLRQLQRALPLMENGEKRIVFFTDVRANKNQCRSSGAYAARMAEAAKHMRLAILHEELQERGYQVRLIDPGDEKDAASAAQAVLGDRFADAHDDRRAAKRRFVMQDVHGRECPW